MGEFGVEAEDADDQEHEEHVWLDDTRKELLTAGKFKGCEPGVGKRKFCFAAIESRDLTAIELAQQAVGRGSDEVDELAVEGFFVGKGFGVSDGGFRECGV